MSCYHPIRAYKSQKRVNGKYILKFDKSQYPGLLLTWLPCGRCIGCRLKYSRIWAARIMHEAQMHEQNSFITLTYDDEHLPEHNFLDKSDFVRFMKRLRKALEPKKVRYFMCGEYGDKLMRPHFHLCLFGHEFGDQVFYKKNALGHKLFTSERLNSIWKKGYCITGALEYDSAAYVARYVTKKINGEKHFETYAHHVDLDTGEIIFRPQEYATMSRGGDKGGIGKKWYEKYKSDLYPHDFTMCNGHRIKPPRYYDEALKEEDPELYERIKKIRESQLSPFDPELREKRLLAKEEFKKEQIKRLTRGENYDSQGF